MATVTRKIDAFELVDVSAVRYNGQVELWVNSPQGEGEVSVYLTREEVKSLRKALKEALNELP